MFIQIGDYLYNKDKIYGIEKRGNEICVFFSGDFEVYQSVEFEHSYQTEECMSYLVGLNL